jgi:hypothetical protein
MAKRAHTESIRQEFEALAQRYEELADYVEQLSRDGTVRAVPPARKRAN